MAPNSPHSRIQSPKNTTCTSRPTGSTECTKEINRNDYDHCGSKSKIQALDQKVMSRYNGNTTVARLCPSATPLGTPPLYGRGGAQLKNPHPCEPFFSLEPPTQLKKYRPFVCPGFKTRRMVAFLRHLHIGNSPSAHKNAPQLCSLRFAQLQKRRPWLAPSFLTRCSFPSNPQRHDGAIIGAPLHTEETSAEISLADRLALSCPPLLQAMPAVVTPATLFNTVPALGSRHSWQYRSEPALSTVHRVHAQANPPLPFWTSGSRNVLCSRSITDAPPMSCETQRFPEESTHCTQPSRHPPRRAIFCVSDASRDWHTGQKYVIRFLSPARTSEI